MAMTYKMRDPIPTLDYLPHEKEVWAFCYRNLIRMFKTNACDEFNWTIDQFQKEIGLCETEIP